MPWSVFWTNRAGKLYVSFLIQGGRKSPRRHQADTNAWSEEIQHGILLIECEERYRFICSPEV